MFSSSTFPILFLFFIIYLFSSPINAATGGDYITSAPTTIFEGAMNSQNMDYDQTNKIFHVHPGWVNDKIIYYYRFRVYSDMTYPEAVKSSPVKLPIAPLFIIATTESLTTAVVNQNPIIQYHHVDGKNNSDIVQIYFVIVDNTYVANTYKSYGDIIDNVVAANIRPSTIYLNLPIVPTGAKLEDYANRASTTVFAPITQTPLWYRGVSVGSFVFEVTDASAKTFFASTRSTATGDQVDEYSIPVKSFVSSTQIVSYLAIFHLNQYTEGVTVGQNNGGPWNMGQKNIINADRDVAYYSPIWGPVSWITNVPVGYSADEASNSAQLTEANGFTMMATMMYANCPNVGPMGGGAINAGKKTTFITSLALKQKDSTSYRITGSLSMMDAGKIVKGFIEIGSSNVEVGSATANMMGAYSITFDTKNLNLITGTGSFKVYSPDNMVIKTVPITVAAPESGAFGVMPSFIIAIATIIAAGKAFIGQL